MNILFPKWHLHSSNLEILLRKCMVVARNLRVAFQNLEGGDPDVKGYSLEFAGFKKLNFFFGI